MVTQDIKLAMLICLKILCPLCVAQLCATSADSGLSRVAYVRGMPDSQEPLLVLRRCQLLYSISEFVNDMIVEDHHCDKVLVYYVLIHTYLTHIMRIPFVVIESIADQTTLAHTSVVILYWNDVQHILRGFIIC